MPEKINREEVFKANEGERMVQVQQRGAKRTLSPSVRPVGQEREVESQWPPLGRAGEDTASSGERRLWGSEQEWTRVSSPVTLVLKWEFVQHS